MDNLRIQLKEKTELSERPEIYTDLSKSQQISKEIAFLTNKISGFDKAEKIIDDASEILELAEEADDESLLGEIEKELLEVEKRVEEMRLASLLRGKYDKLNALITLHSGAGGTEACDWTEMLYRMYILYAEKNGYTLT